MKDLVAVIALSFLSFLSVAQNSTYPDRIKLINGSLIKGTIIVDKVGEYVEIIITGKQTVSFKYDEIWCIKDGVEKRKMTSEFDASKNKWEHKFAIVDVTGGSASAKIELFKDGKQVYTDYLSLLKFDSGWKIVAKVYHKHE